MRFLNLSINFIADFWPKHSLRKKKLPRWGQKSAIKLILRLRSFISKKRIPNKDSIFQQVNFDNKHFFSVYYKIIWCQTWMIQGSSKFCMYLWVPMWECDLFCRHRHWRVNIKRFEGRLGPGSKVFVLK